MPAAHDAVSSSPSLSRVDRLARALIECYVTENRSKTLQQIAEQYNFTYTDIWRHRNVINRLPNIFSQPRVAQLTLVRNELEADLEHSNKQRFLSRFELECLVSWVETRHAQDAPPKRRQVIGFAASIRQQMRGGARVTPSNNWYKQLCNTHRHRLSYISSSDKDPKRAEAEQQIENIGSWFESLRRRVIEGRYRPEQILACDETGFVVDRNRLLMEKVLVPHGKSAKKISTLQNNQHFSVLHIASMTGVTVPPITMFEGSYISPTCLDAAPEKSVMSAQTNGYFESKHFLDVLRHIVRCYCPEDIEPVDKSRDFELWQTKRQLNARLSITDVVPLLLILDNARCHYDSEAQAFAAAHHVELFYLPPHLTHKLQVSDVGVFRSLKFGWNKALKALEDRGGQFSRESFWPLLKPAWDYATRSEAVIAAFAAVGLSTDDDGGASVNGSRIINSLKAKKEKATAPITDSSALSLALAVERISHLEAQNHYLEADGQLLRRDLATIRAEHESSSSDSALPQSSAFLSDSLSITDSSSSEIPPFLARIDSLITHLRPASLSESAAPESRPLPQSNLDRPYSFSSHEDLALLHVRAQANKRGVKWKRTTVVEGAEALKQGLTVGDVERAAKLAAELEAACEQKKQKTKNRPAASAESENTSAQPKRARK